MVIRVHGDLDGRMSELVEHQKKLWELCLVKQQFGLNQEIKLAYFPKIVYFLEQENGKVKENTNSKRDDRTASKRQSFAATALFSFFEK